MSLGMPVSGPDSLFPLTFFETFAASKKVQGEWSLEGLARKIAAASAAKKGDLPWLKLATFGDVRTDRNSLRHDGNVLSVTGVEADYDAAKVTFDEAVDIATNKGLLALIYTSPSHTEDNHRWRILCPLADPVSAAGRDKMMGRLNGLYRGIFAGESWAVSQSYYFGSVGKNPSHRVELVEGTPIDLHDDLDEIWLGKPDTAARPRAEGQAFTSGPANEAALLEQIVSGASYHTASVRVLGKWARAGVPLMDARRRLLAVFEGIPEGARDERWKSRYGDIDRCLEDIYGSEADEKDKGNRPAKDVPPTQSAVDDGTPLLRIVAGELDTLTSSAEASIIGSDVPVYQRGHDLVRPTVQEVTASHGRTTVAAALSPLTPHSLIDIFSGTARWEKFDARAKGWIRANPPRQVADILLSRQGQWSVPAVAGIITTPTLRPDGSILSARGYDPATRLYHAADASLALRVVVEKPTPSDAKKALAVLKELISGFPFVDGVSLAVGLSGLITPVVRGALPNAPLHAYRASTAGTGKSYLADTSSAIATGRPCPVIAAAPDDESETEKRLTGLLLAGYPIISIDNVNGELGGDLLCQALDRPLIRVRALGRSDIFEIESRATIKATGNNLRVRGDMTRRSLVADLDAGMERPELRVFCFDPVEKVLADRGRYVSACLVIVRAYLLAGSPGKLKPIASFEAWSDLIRSALVWLGCDDPADSMEQAREEDSDLSALREVVSAWYDTFGTSVMTVKKAVVQAGEHIVEADENGDRPEHGGRMVMRWPDLVQALKTIAPGQKGEIDNKRLGKWLLSVRGRVVSLPTGMRRFKRMPGLSAGSTQWRIEVEEAGKWS